MKLLGTLTLLLALTGLATAQTNPQQSVSGTAGTGDCSTVGAGYVVQSIRHGFPKCVAGGGGGGGGAPTGPAGGSLTGSYPNPGLAAPYASSSFTAHGVIIGEAGANLAATAAGAIDSLLAGQGASADPLFISLLSCSAANSALTYNTTTHAFGCNAIAVSPLNSLPAQTGNYNAQGFDLTNIGNLTVVNSGINKGLTGELNNIFNVKAFGASGGGSTDDVSFVQAAYDAACAVTAIPGIVPEVYFPYGKYQFIAKGLQADCAGGSVTLAGDSQWTSSINATGHFTAIDNTATSAYSGLGTMTVASLVSGSFPAMNFAQGSYPVGAWFLNLGQAMFPQSSGTANPLNGLAAMTIRFYLKPPTVDANPHTIVNSSNLTGDGTHSANTALNISYTGTTLTAAVNTGSTRKTSPTSATGTIASNTVSYIEFDVDCASSGYMAVFYGAPGGTTSHGTAQACSGNVLQELNEEMDIAEASPGSVVAGPNMQGALESFEIEKVALHTCPAGTCTNFTAPSTDFSADGNTLVLGPNSVLSHGGQVEAWGMAYPAGNTQIPVMSDGAAQDNAADIKNLTVTSPTESILYQLRPNSSLDNLNIETSGNSAYAGIQLYNNVYNSQAANILIDNAGRFGMIEQNDSSMFTWRLRSRFALTDYLGTGILDKCEITIGGAATIIPVQFQTNQAVLPPTMTDCEIDNESGYAGPIVYFDMTTPATFKLSSGQYNTAGSFPVMNLPLNSTTYFNLGIHDAFLNSTSTPIIGNVSGNTKVVADNVSYNNAGPPTATQLCGSSYTSNCFVLNQPAAVPVYGAAPVPTGSPSPVLGTSSSPAVVTAADTTSGDWQVVVAGSFNGTLGTPPNGWTVAPGCPGGGTAIRDASTILVHHNGGGEPGTNSFPFTSGSWDFYPIGVHNTTGPDGQASCTASNTNTVTIPAPTGTSNVFDLVLALGGLSGGGTSSVSYTSGPTASTWVTVGSSYFGLGKYYTGPGSQVIYTGVGGTATDDIGAQIAFAPVQGGYPVLITNPQTAVGTGAFVSMISGSATTTVSNSAANVFPAYGVGAPVATTSEGTVTQGSPFAGTLSNLECYLTNAAGTKTVAGGTNYVLALRQNLASSALTCTITAAITNCQDTTAAHNVTIAVGDQLSFIDTPNGTPTALIPHCGVQLVY